MTRTRILLLVTIGAPIVVLVYVALNLDYYAGAGRLGTAPIERGEFLPPPAPEPDNPAPPMTRHGRAIIENLAARELPYWEEQGKIHAPRIMLAKTLLRRETPDVNGYLMRLRPWGRSGSTWALHPEGDYDFTLTVLITMLYLFGEEPRQLIPDARMHLLNELLIETGGTPRTKVPQSLGLVLDTENHHLMTESSRYLTNQWWRVHEDSNDPRHDNRSNGLEEWLIAYLDEIIDEGVYEFNSIPYFAYMIHPLLNLEAFAESEEIRSRARYILDISNLVYALGSLDFRRHAPFRRQIHRGEGELSTDPHTAAMKVWLSEPYERGDPLPAPLASGFARPKRGPPKKGSESISLW